MHKNPLAVGDPAPWFTCRAPVNPRFNFGSVAGRYVVLCFFESAADGASRRVLDAFLARRDVFDGRDFAFFGVSVDPDDERLGRVADVAPGMRFFWDFDRAVSGASGVVTPEGAAYRRMTYVLDLRLRVIAALPFEPQPEAHVARVLECLAALPPITPSAPAQPSAPVLVVPDIFEAELCRTLIETYERRGGAESGFMREVDGRTIGMIDYGHKRRRDCEIDDPALRNACMARIHDRLIPEILKAYQFQATRMERYIVACYDAAEGGYFRPHRDNTTRGTAHRRFAVSLFLNAGEYDGGFLRFPEFGRALYGAPTGGAVVFSCSLLHEALPVRRGRRYMFLPFLYDEAAAQLREENLRFVGGA